MPKLPNEILDQIWFERCKLGFEPRIFQARWVRDGRLHVPAFYTAQDQAFMTQLCRGARQVAAKGFYSRISDDPFTGHGGFWWHEKDVLYVDQDFYRMLRTPHNAIFMGRVYITRVAVDIKIDTDATVTAITQLLLDWFPRLSQFFSLCPARLIPALQHKEYEDYEEYNGSGPRAPRSMGPGVWTVGPAPLHARSSARVTIPKHLLIRAQGLQRELRAKISRRRERAEYARQVRVVHKAIPLFIFGRDDYPPAINPRNSQNGKEVEGPYEDPMTLESVENHVARNSEWVLRQIVKKDPRYYPQG